MHVETIGLYQEHEEFIDAVLDVYWPVGQTFLLY